MLRGLIPDNRSCLVILGQVHQIPLAFKGEQ